MSMTLDTEFLFFNIPTEADCVQRHLIRAITNWHDDAVSLLDDVDLFLGCDEDDAHGAWWLQIADMARTLERVPEGADRDRSVQELRLASASGHMLISVWYDDNIPGCDIQLSRYTRDHLMSAVLLANGAVIRLGKQNYMDYYFARRQARVT